MQETICFVVCLLIGGTVAQQWPQVTVQTSKGTVIGYTKDLGNNRTATYYGKADVFVGIPYAKPPVGNFRFAYTQDVTAWSTPLDLSNSTIWPPMCPQNLGFPSNQKQTVQSEDCLYMNIFSPNVNTATKYPVMFFIHGGAFATGAVGVYEDDGIIRNLVDRGVVVVVIQYRLNVLGFFTTNTTEFPANLGLFDQLQALKFVQNEIGAFGGDKNRVTIFGQSAGACSVSAHTYSPLSRGLFQQALMESGNAELCFDGTFEFGYWSQRVAQQFCNFTSAMWNAGTFFGQLKDCMMNVDFHNFTAVNQDHGPLPWVMIVDGDFMPDFPRNLAATRPASYSNMPVLMGTNADEWGFYELVQIVTGQLQLQDYNSSLSRSEMAYFMRMYGEKQPLITDILTSVYITPLNLNDSQHTEWLKVISRWHTDGAFEAGACREVDRWRDVNNNPNVYLYRNTYRSKIISLISAFNDYTGWNPVGHAEELLFVFMLPQFWLASDTTVSKDDLFVADWFGKTWTDFAKYGNITQSANWQPVTDPGNSSNWPYFEINSVNPGMRPYYGFNARNMFNQVLPSVAFLTPVIPPPWDDGTGSTIPIPPPTPGLRVVSTTKGIVIGYNRYLGDNKTQLYYGSADVFLGVPYAAPPVGSLRFAKPLDVPVWSQSLNATIWPPQCPQKNGIEGNPAGQVISEDCLYMNIFSPNVNSSTKYPVMLFIHGGAFSSGNVGTYGIDGVIRNLVSRGVVVVIIQYRLNVLGFFTTNTTEFPANLGLLDQVQALKFVQKEIGAFGGDKNRVTIFGQSAGACSVSAHTYSPLSQGLFQQAIMESGNAELCFDGTFEFGYWSQRVAQQFCNFTSAMWNAGTYFGQLKNCMQTMDFNNFLHLNQDHGPLPWVMTVDGYFMPDLPRNLAAKRPANYSNMPVIIGTNHDEWGFYELMQIVTGQLKLEDYNRSLSQSEMAAFMGMYGDKKQTVVDIINSVFIDPYNLNDSQHLQWLEVISKWHTAASFEAGAAREVDRWRDINNNPNVYIYRNTYRSMIISLIGSFYNYTGWDPVGHGEELLFIFMMPNYWQYNTGATALDFMIADWFGQTWTDFAKTGNPTPMGGWQPINAANAYQYFEISANGSSMKSSYAHNARNVFNQVVPKLTFLTPVIPPPWNDGTDSPTTTTSVPAATTTIALPATTTTLPITTSTTSGPTTTTATSASMTTTAPVSMTTTAPVSMTTTSVGSSTSTTTPSTATSPTASTTTSGVPQGAISSLLVVCIAVFVQLCCRRSL